MLRNNESHTSEIRELYAKYSTLNDAYSEMGGRLERINRNVRSLMTTRANTPAAPVSNLLWNGELGHSVNSWHDAAYVSTDKAKEAAWWFSHNKPAAVRTFVDADVTWLAVDTITISAHPYTTGQTLDLITTGVLPGGLATATTYFVIVVDANTIKLATTVANAFAGTQVNITSAAGGGTHTVQEKLVSVDGRTSSVNNTLKATSHSTYDARYARWSSTNGWAELTGTMSLDQILPGNFIDATTPLARVSLIAAKRNAYIEITDACLMGAGIYDNTSGQRKFLTGDIGLSAVVVGAPAVGVERRYRVLLTSDQGYQLLSTEVTVAVAPKDSEFSSTVYVALSWRQQAGQLQTEIYEYLPSGPEGGGAAAYRLITQISSANSYIHLGSFLSTEGGYPSATGSIRSATLYTNTAELAELATNAVSPMWSTINFPVGVPNNYNKANTTDRQWIRVWLTVAPNLFVEGCTTDGSTTLTAPAAVFEAEYDSLFDAGTLVAQVYSSSDVLLATTTIASRTDDTHVVLGTSIATGSGRKLRIVAGGFHGIIIDKIHLGYQQNTSYAPNALDIRTLQPVAAPTSSSQGGVGTGGSGGGIGGYCVAIGTPVKRHAGDWHRIELCDPGELWSAAGLNPNMLVRLKPGFDWVRRVRAANGCEIECTNTERFIVADTDHDGVALYSLRVGDQVMTEIDGRTEATKIVEISEILRQEFVFTPTLSDSHYFLAGRIENKGWRRRFKYWLKRRLGVKTVAGGFILHNRKEDPE